jgi:hypothetical protein
MTFLSSSMKKTAMAALAASVIAGGVTTFSATSAEAQWVPRYGGGYGYRPYRPNRGLGVAAGVIGGLAAGALIAGAVNPGYAAPAYGHPGYAGPSYGYAAPQPVYGGGGGYYEPAYQQTCYFRKVRQVVDYDTVVIRRVRVCD